MEALARLLTERGLETRFAQEARVARALIPAAHSIVTNYPSKIGISMEDILALAGREARIWLCGPRRWEGDARVQNLWSDEALLIENAYLTAEGAMSSAMRAGSRCLRGLPCVVIGWGRIGSALTRLLLAMGASVTVISRDVDHREQAATAGAEAVAPEEMSDTLAHAGVIFSTPPARVLNEAHLSRLGPDTMVIDLASAPYGVDLEAAWRLGLRAWREPGLPGRYCPESAARALLNAMMRGEMNRG